MKLKKKNIAKVNVSLVSWSVGWSADCSSSSERTKWNKKGVTNSNKNV